MSSLQIPGKRLAVQPLGTSITNIYRNSSDAQGQIAVLTGLWVCNRGSESATVTIYSEPANTASDNFALVHDYTIAAGEFLLLPGSNAGPIFLQPDEAISGEASGASLITITVYGYLTDPRAGN